MISNTALPHRMKLLVAAAMAVLFTALPTPARLAALTNEGPPVLTAKSAILIEAKTGTVLYQSNADLPFPPASLTKLMTLDIVLDQIAEGTIDPNQVVTPHQNAWSANQPKDSSLMFLGPNQRVSVQELLLGLAVASGNDAAVELADLVAGSVPDFVDLMNAQARRLGFPDMRFTDPAGIRSDNRITAREYVNFCRLFVERHPEALKELLSVKRLVYPLPANLINGNTQPPITQFNRNLLLWKNDGVDGLKTGFIDQSGYNSAVTAERDGMRLIAVILGIPGPMGDAAAERQRAEESERLLDYGFKNFTMVEPSFSSPAPVKVWKGSERRVTIAPESTPAVVLPLDESDGLSTRIRQVTETIAPVHKGDVLGHIVVLRGGKEVATLPLVATAGVRRGSFVRDNLDSLWLWIRGLLGRPLREP